MIDKLSFSLFSKFYFLYSNCFFRFDQIGKTYTNVFSIRDWETTGSSPIFLVRSFFYFGFVEAGDNEGGVNAPAKISVDLRAVIPGILSLVVATHDKNTELLNRSPARI